MSRSSELSTCTVYPTHTHAREQQPQGKMISAHDSSVCTLYNHSLSSHQCTHKVQRMHPSTQLVDKVGCKPRPVIPLVENVARSTPVAMWYHNVGTPTCVPIPSLLPPPTQPTQRTFGRFSVATANPPLWCDRTTASVLLAPPLIGRSCRSTVAARRIFRLKYVPTTTSHSTCTVCTN
jgi:hypothetical protein